MIKDHLLANGLKPHTVEVTAPLIKAYRSGQKSMAELEEAKK